MMLTTQELAEECVLLANMLAKGHSVTGEDVRGLLLAAAKRMEHLDHVLERERALQRILARSSPIQEAPARSHAYEQVERSCDNG